MQLRQYARQGLALVNLGVQYKQLEVAQARDGSERRAVDNIVTEANGGQGAAAECEAREEGRSRRA